MSFEKLSVGQGVSLVYPSDIYPYVVTRVSDSGKTAWVKPLTTVNKSTGHSPKYFKGPWPVWDHEYTTDEIQSLVNDDSPETRIFLSKNGWSYGPLKVKTTGAFYYRDFSN